MDRPEANPVVIRLAGPDARALLEVLLAALDKAPPWASPAGVAVLAAAVQLATALRVAP